MKVFVVHPDILGKLKLADEARANHKSGDTTLLSVIGDALGQRQTIGCTTADHAAPISASSLSGDSTRGAPLRHRPMSFAATSSCSSAVPPFALRKSRNLPTCS